jgi:hypothetical protein
MKPWRMQLTFGVEYYCLESGVNSREEVSEIRVSQQC